MSEPLGRGEWLRRIRQRLQWGVPPLTHEECVRLYEYATGDTIEKRRRCKSCEGEGKVPLTPMQQRLYLDPKSAATCRVCEGLGYTKEGPPCPNTRP